ncbi:ATP-binding protein [Candidatus Saganbacteria bacterium]|nr:ATP-binding protein [Candidatus Saganbacteria bacterium]
MLEEYFSHNLFWEDMDRFTRDDPHLSLLNELLFVHPLDWWRQIDWQEPGIFILTGGRQIGKSTSLKLLVKQVVNDERIKRESIFYLPCDQIIDQKHLLRVLRFFLENRQRPQEPFLLLIDEVTFVASWDRAIKALADESWFRHGFCVLTGSDSVILKEATTMFPGRRGKADKVDFHLSPLSFKEYIGLVQPEIIKKERENSEALFAAFFKYLKCGGYLRAINDLHKGGEIKAATYATFEQWIRGDFIKRGKTEDRLLSVLQALVETGVSQSSYSNLSRRTTLLSKESFIDYCQLLERMDVLFNLQAFDQNRKLGFPKKARKFHFSDPFIHDTIERWLIRERLLSLSTLEEFKVEACVAAQYRHFLPAYYLKAEGEIDLMLPLGRLFLPIEVKWSGQVRAKDLAQLKKQKKAVILTKMREQGRIEGVFNYPLPLFLIKYHSKELLEAFLRD